jgi:uncharacterized protein involved in exopolysaccharide biosynthesis
MIEQFSLQHIASLIGKKWKAMLLAIVLITAIAVGISFLYPNLYKSNVVVYPANNYLNDRNYYYNNAIQNLYSQYGGDEEIDKIIEIGSLQPVLEKIADSLKLYEHYDIDESNKVLRTYKSAKKLDDRIMFLRTNNNGLEIAVWDKDRAKSAEILKVLLDQINTYVLKLHGERLNNEYNLLNNKVALISKELQEINAKATDPAFAIRKQATEQQLAETEKLRMSILASPTVGKAFYEANPIYTKYKKDKPQRLLVALFSAIAASVLVLLLAVGNVVVKK